MLFDKDQMSPDEWQFIRAYCYSVQKHYDRLQTIRVLMNPDWLAVRCPTTATRMAQQLHTMQEDCDSRLEEIGAKHAIKQFEKFKQKKKTKPEQVAEVFTLSFFKIVDPHLKKAFLADKTMPTHDGWSSGHPSDWQQTLKALSEIYKQKAEKTDGPIGPFLQSLLKLFAALPSKSWVEDENAVEEDDEYLDEYDDDDDFGPDNEDDDPMSFFM